MRTRFWLFVGLALLSSCKFENGEDRGKFRITATTNIMADGVRALVGDSAVVTPIMAVGVDPHLYKASQRDLDLLFEADLVVYHGLHLEGKMVEVLHKFSRTHPVVNVGATLPPTLLIASPDYANTVDPHIWFDVHLWSIAMRNLKDEIIKRKPAWKSYVNANWAKFKAQLDELDQYSTQKIKSITNQGQVLITAHDAFSYFGKAYQIEVKGLQGLSTLSEPGLNDVSSLVSFIIEKDIKAIFVEQSISPRAIKAVVEGCKRKGHQVTLAGPLYTDSLGDPNGPAGTYVGMVKTNVDEIVNNLNQHDTTNRASGS
ncbi:metal ABC transporter solute-binding protein, Zn/Mn family [Echinicola rosea]|uniref:Manganese transporter n=1 Tax=Echinicola rosea TaxID=1807691 RepID=A0ABQ1V4X5_9BACT|nr:zinc ABC transporter substrate-binding protein [Echinicola rosea]GGF39155.1 manganese transporter [Echinicola rosea]